MNTNRGLSALICVVCLIVCSDVAQCAEADAARILLIGKKPDHPFGTHMYMHTHGVLVNCLQLTEGVETVVSEGWPEDRATLDGVKAIVVYSSPAAEFLLDGPGAEQLHQMMQDGVGLVTGVREEPGAAGRPLDGLHGRNLGVELWAEHRYVTTDAAGA